MASIGRGDTENNKLKAKVEDQLNRLLTQLQDIEEMKDELDEEEYNSSRQETIDQLREFEGTLAKMMSGNVTLVDELSGMQLAIQSAIRSAFKSPEVIRMFAKKENGSLRSRLAQLESDFRLGRVSSDDYLTLSAEVLTALEKLGETLTPKERELMERKTKNMSQYEAASGSDAIGARVLSSAISDTQKSAAASST